MGNQSNKIMEWDGKTLKYGIPKKCMDILGEYAKVYSAERLDGIGTFEAQELRDEAKMLGLKLHDRYAKK